MVLKCECLKHFKDGGTTVPSRGRGIFQQKNICDLVRELFLPWRRDARVVEWATLER